MKRLLIASLLLAPLASQAVPCSQTVSGIRPNMPLSEEARVTPAKAHQIALDAVGGAARFDTGVLQVQDGCLIYRFDFKRTRDAAREHVFVDAGNGDVLALGEEASRVLIVPEPGPPIR
jgi:hypothetical protein